MKIPLGSLLLLLPVPQTLSMILTLFGDDVLEALVLLTARNEALICTDRVLHQAALRPISTGSNEKVQKFTVLAGLAEV